MFFPSVANVKKTLKYVIRCIRMGERGGAHRVVVKKPEGRRKLGRPRLIWEDNIKMGFIEVGWGHGLD
jgi:hypothetical protein